MFARELAFIKNLERLEQGASKDIRPSNALKASELTTNPFNDLINLFSPLVLAFFVNISQFSGLSLG